MLVYIRDILESMNLIEKYIRGFTFDKFKENYEIQDAVIRRLGIIGEAASRLTKEFKEKNFSIPWKQIIGLRNVLIHEYSDVKLEIVWKIIKEDLPKTKKKIEKITPAT